MAKCKICNQEFENDRQLHGHLKAHQMRMAEYYQKYFPRYDLYNKKIIRFKNKNQYLSANFNNRRNLKLWLSSVPNDEAKGYCIDFLCTRVKEKNIVYTPSQIELRSLMSPPIQYYEDLFGDYYDLCKKMDLKNKYTKITDIVVGYEWNKPEYKILIDTREQKPLRFDRDIEIRKLDFGDYAFNSSTASCNCYIERKSLPDFIGTLSGGYERFIKEIQRADLAGAHLVILIESKFTNALYFNERRKRNKEKVFKNIKATPEFIFHRVRNLAQKYPHIQFLFVNGRKEASRVIEKIFTSGCAHEKIDLQLAYDLEKL